MISVRERPPLRHTYELIAPSGRRYRWAADEPDPANVPSGARHSSTIPGGHESFDCVLPRKPGVVYSDLEAFTTVIVRSASGEKRGEFRIERTPRVSGDKMAITPSAVGWQAALEDDKTIRPVIVDRDLSNWKDPSGERRLALLTAGHNVVDGGSSEPNATSGFPQLLLRHQVQATDAAFVVVESWYDAAGDEVAEIDYDYVVTGGSSGANGLEVAVADDDQAAGEIGSGDLYGTATGSGPFTPATAKRWAYWQFNNQATYPDDKERTAQIGGVAVWGNHPIPRLGTAPERGVLGSDVRAYAVPRWAPSLRVTPESIQPSNVVIPQLAWRAEPTTVAELVRQSNRFELHDWAVWDDRTFWSYERGSVGKRWRARIAPAQLEETGPQVDRIWEAVMVAYQDVDGSTRTVGWPGSGADTEDPLLKDLDPENPANKLGIPRRDLLVMGIGTPRSAAEVGARFLQESRLLDTSGRAQHVGYVVDDRGVIYPYSAVRAGDYVSYFDSSDPGYRRVVKADHNHVTRTCSVDLDSPPEGLAALLELLGVVLVPLGL